MKFVFINPPTINNRKITRNCDCASESKGNYLLQPFDLLYLSAKIKETDELLFIDAVAQGLTQDFTINSAIQYNADVAVLMMVDTLWDSDFLFLKKFRSQFKGQLYVMGDAFVEKINRNEVALHCNGIIDNPWKFNFYQNDFVTPIEYNKLSKRAELVTLGLPRHNQFINSNYRWPFARHKAYTSIALSWGCPFACTYCIDSVFPFFFRDISELENELRYIRKLGIQEINFTDKSFGLPFEQIKKLLNHMIENAYTFSWSTYFNPRQSSDELFRLMSEAGCHTVIIGIESFNHDDLKIYNRKSSESMIKNTIDLAHKYNIDVCGDFLFGLKNQTISDMYKNIDYSLTLDLDYASFNIAAPLPGSEVRKEAISSGRMKENDHHYDSVGKGRVLPSLHCNEDDLLKIRNTAVRKFYLRPSYLFKRLFRIKSYTHLLIQLEEMFSVFIKISNITKGFGDK